jgi:sn-glycerol 3-phosphate transport system ATP-binding protein
VPFVVEFLEELGAGRLAHGMLEGADFILSLPPGATLQPGETCRLHFAPAAMHLFDAATGHRCHTAGEAASAARAPALAGIAGQ